MNPLQTATLFGLGPDVFIRADSAIEAITAADPLDDADLTAIAAASQETLPDQSAKLRQLLEGRGKGPQAEAQLRAELKKMIGNAGEQWVQIANAALLHRAKAVTKKPTWKSDDQFRAAWNLYKELSKLWPARGEEKPTAEFKIFQARYRSEKVCGRYLQEIGDLALNSYLDFLLVESPVEASQKHFYPVYTALRKKPDINRLVWRTIFSKIPGWDLSRLPFDAQRTFDDWARALHTFRRGGSVATILAGRSLFDFQMGLESSILALAALEFQKQRLLEKSGRTELSMRDLLPLEAGLKSTLAAAIPNIFSSALGFLAAVEQYPFSNPSFKSLLSLLNDWLNRALPDIQNTPEQIAKLQKIKEALYNNGSKAIRTGRSPEETAFEFSRIMEETTLVETVLLLRSLSDGSLEGEMHQKAVLLLQEMLEKGYVTYLAGARERAGQLRSLFSAKDPPWPEDLNLDFIHAFAYLTFLFQKHPFSLSKEGWMPLDQTKTEVLAAQLDFACATLSEAKVVLEMAGYAGPLRETFLRGGEYRSKFEGETRYFQQALIQVEGKERELPADHPGQPYLMRAKEMLYKLRNVINETTGLWEMKQ